MPLGLGVESIAPEFLFVPRGAAFFLTPSVGGSIAVGPLGATGAVAGSALISAGGDDVAGTAMSAGEGEAFATSGSLDGDASFRSSAGDNLSLMMSELLVGGFLALLLLATAGVAVEGWFDGMVLSVGDEVDGNCGDHLSTVAKRRGSGLFLVVFSFVLCQTC